MNVEKSGNFSRLKLWSINIKIRWNDGERYVIGVIDPPGAHWWGAGRSVAGCWRSILSCAMVWVVRPALPDVNQCVARHRRSSRKGWCRADDKSSANFARCRCVWHRVRSKQTASSAGPSDQATCRRKVTIFCCSLPTNASNSTGSEKEDCCANGEGEGVGCITKS